MNHVKEEIDALLLPGNNPWDPEKIKAHVAVCQDCRVYSEENIALDETLASMGKLHILTDQEWDTLIENAVPQQESRPVFTNHEWNSMFENVWQKSQVQQRRVFKFNLFVKPLYALAASIILLIGAYLIFRPTQLADTPISKKSHIQEQPVIEKTLAKREKPGEFLNINKHCTILASENAKIKVIKNTPARVQLSLVQGAAAFKVDKNVYKSFTVHTQDAEITVIGTIFDVWFQGGGTRVSVIQGKVQVLYKNLTKKLVLTKNTTSIPMDNKIEVKDLSETEKQVLQPFLNKLGQVRKIKPFQGQMPEPKPKVPEQTFLNLEKGLNQGFELISRKDYEGALAAFNNIKEAGTNNRIVQTAWFESAKLKINRLNHVREGVGDLATYIESSRTPVFHEEALVELVKANRALNQRDKVLLYERQYLNRYLDKSYAKDFLYEAATILREEKKDFQEAVIYYDFFIEKYKKDYRIEDAYLWLGKCYLSLNNNNRANAVFKTYIDKYPNGRWISDIQKLLHELN